MNTPDKITQVYQDAFRDLAVEAPASVQAGALKQLGRKSLLTIDPTRFNVFYMALISGALAWAIIGTNSNELVLNDTPEQIVVDDVQKTENDGDFSALQSANTSETLQVSQEESIPVNDEKVMTATKVENRKLANSTMDNISNAQSTHEFTSKKEQFIESPKAKATHEAIAQTIESPKMITPIEADLEPSLIDLVDPVSLVGARVQSANSFIRQIKLDSDEKLKLAVIKK